MNTIKMFLGAALVGSAISTSAFAYVEQPTPWPQAPRADVPVITKVVNPTGLPERYEGTTVDLAFTVDANGAPRNIRLQGSSDSDLAKHLIPVISQWRFTPVQKKGVPVSTRVQMPLKLIANS